jgi:hypothetical protein
MKNMLFVRLVILLLAAGALLPFQGCKKGGQTANPAGGGGSYEVSFKANGAQIKYTSEAAAVFTHTATDNLYSGLLEGFQDYNSTGGEHIAILLYDNKAIATGVYQDPEKAADASGTKTPKVLINYYKDAADNYISMGTFVDENGNMPPGTGTAVADAKVTITKVTATTVEGSFSGTVFLSTDASFGSKVTLTDGKFSVKRID